MNVEQELKDAKLLSETLKNGKKIYQIFSKELETNLVIHGHPPKYWEDKFRLHIPTDNLNPTLCKELNVKLLERHQEAAFFYAESSARLQMFKSGNEAVYNTKFNEIIAEYKAAGKSLPAAATLERMTRLANLGIDVACSQSEMESKFWRNILNHLEVCRKLLEQASINLATERKALEQDRINDHLLKNYHGGNSNVDRS